MNGFNKVFIACLVLLIAYIITTGRVKSTEPSSSKQHQVQQEASNGATKKLDQLNIFTDNYIALDRHKFKDHLKSLLPKVMILDENIIYHEHLRLYQVLIQGSMFYMAGDGSYLVKGDVIDIEKSQSNPEKANLTKTYEQAIAKAKGDFSKSNLPESELIVRDSNSVSALLKTLPSQNVITYSPELNILDDLFIFYDLSCPKCLDFKSEIPELVKFGYRIHLVLISRTGIDSLSFKSAEKLMCQTDQKRSFEIFTKSSLGLTLNCTIDLTKNQNTFAQLNVLGTPATFSLKNGKGIVGAYYAKDLIQKLYQ